MEFEPDYPEDLNKSKFKNRRGGEYKKTTFVH